MQDKALLMTLADLRELVRRLFAHNDSKAMKDRALVVFQWSLIWRSFDVGDIHCSQLQWNDSFLIVRVRRKKARQQHSAAVFSTALQ